MVLFFPQLSFYFSLGFHVTFTKWKEGVAKLNHIEEELSDLMLHHGK